MTTTNKDLEIVGSLNQLIHTSRVLLGSIDAVRDSFRSELGEPLPIFGLSNFELALIRAEEAING